jgi:hypothetical protein
METTKNFSQETWSPNRDLKPGPLKYEAGVLTTRSRRSVFQCELTFLPVYVQETSVTHMPKILTHNFRSTVKVSVGEEMADKIRQFRLLEKRTFQNRLCITM